MDPELAQHETFGALIRGILTDLKTLLQEGIALGRIELREQAEKARAAALSFGIAAAGLLFGLAFLLIAIATAISEQLGWPSWAGFLIVGLLMSIVGVVALSLGRRRIRTLKVIPTETVTTLKENSEWIAKRLSSVRK
jgi:MFS family permease